MTRQLRLAILILAGLACQPSASYAAGRYRCTQIKSGATTYSESVCPPGNQCMKWDGKAWSAQACADVIQAQLDAANSPKVDPEADAEKRREGWAKLCGLGTIRYQMDCLKDHERGFAEVVSEVQSSPATTGNAAKAAACYERWFVATAGVVDGRMLRACYFSP